MTSNHIEFHGNTWPAIQGEAYEHAKQLWKQKERRMAFLLWGFGGIIGGCLRLAPYIAAIRRFLRPVTEPAARTCRFLKRHRKPALVILVLAGSTYLCYDLLVVAEKTGEPFFYFGPALVIVALWLVISLQDGQGEDRG